MATSIFGLDAFGLAGAAALCAAALSIGLYEIARALGRASSLRWLSFAIWLFLVVSAALAVHRLRELSAGRYRAEPVSSYAHNEFG